MLSVIGTVPQPHVEVVCQSPDIMLSSTVTPATHEFFTILKLSFIIPVEVKNLASISLGLKVKIIEPQSVVNDLLGAIASCG